MWQVIVGIGLAVLAGVAATSSMAVGTRRKTTANKAAWEVPAGRYLVPPLAIAAVEIAKFDDDLRLLGAVAFGALIAAAMAYRMIRYRLGGGRLVRIARDTLFPLAITAVAELVVFAPSWGPLGWSAALGVVVVVIVAGTVRRIGAQGLVAPKPAERPAGAPRPPRRTTTSTNRAARTSAPKPAERATMPPTTTITAENVEFLLGRAGFIVNRRWARITGDETWTQYRSLNWTQVTRFEFATSGPNPVVALYALTGPGDRTHLADSEQLKPAQWVMVAAAVARYSASRHKIDLDQRATPRRF